MICIADEVAVRLIDFVDRRDIDWAIQRALAATPASPGSDPARVTPTEACQRQVLQYFHGQRLTFDFPLAQPGTPFQHRCWNALQRIPFGQTQTYTQQTLTFAALTSLRAVAQANAHNFCAIVIPCHRVIGTSGDLRGYGGGIERKRWLIDHERAIVQGVAAIPSTLFAAR